MSQSVISDMLAAFPAPAVLIDTSERILAANADARTLLGHHIEGRHFATILRQPAVIDAIEATLRAHTQRTARHLANDGAQDTTFEVTCRFVGAVGASRGGLGRGGMKLDGVGKSGAVMVTFQDVTQVQQAGQMRRDFVANVSHELRTPLTALMGFIETLRGAAREDPAARDRFLGIMEKEAGRMNRLVGDLLSLSRVEGDERVRPSATLDLCAHLSSTLKSITPLAESSDVALVLTLPDSRVEVQGDGDQLHQVFSNLIENAIKYGGSGGRVDVTLTASDHDPALRGPGARIQVSDKGPGIDPLHLPRLTERFYRADNHRSRELGGTGLGLAIVKHIINRHRGRLRVQSDLGQGATFTVVLPITPVE
ncbi:MAG: sensor histidine kinase [Sedimentitalea sp.]